MPVEIKEYYSVKPSFDPKASVERLLAGIPQKYISGLATVILRDSDSLNHDRRRTKLWRLGKKVRARECVGLYHEAWKGEPAWIEIFIDNVLSGVKDSIVFRLTMCFSMMSDFIIGEALYHEIGHHIHKSKLAESGEREYIADRWERRLMHDYFWYRYPYLAILIYFLYWPIWKFKKIFFHTHIH